MRALGHAIHSHTEEIVIRVRRLVPETALALIKLVSDTSASYASIDYQPFRHLWCRCIRLPQR